jgi:hypothetical protein
VLEVEDALRHHTARNSTANHSNVHDRNAHVSSLFIVGGRV